MSRRMKMAVALVLVTALCLSALTALAGGIVKTTGSVNLRKGAGLGYKIIRSIGKGVKLDYDKTKKDGRGVLWYRVTYKGKTGWVSSKYAKEATASGKVKTTGNVHLRAGAGLGYKSLRIIATGKTMSYDKTKKDGRGVLWYRVTYKGTTGWVSSKYAKKQ